MSDDPLNLVTDTKWEDMTQDQRDLAILIRVLITDRTIAGRYTPTSVVARAALRGAAAYYPQNEKLLRAEADVMREEIKRAEEL